MRTVGATEEQYKNRQKKYKRSAKKDTEKRTAEPQEDELEAEPEDFAE